jgi:anti-sigma regulatory factor (Ser/Thr protein kinase)
MAGLAVRETVMLAGRAERARLARAFVEGLLGSGHPCGDVAALLVDELFVNSIRHSGSGAPGETVTVAVRTENDVIRVEVTDRSGPGAPEPRTAGSDAEDGRGLHLVARLATRWGWRRGGRTVTWFEIQALLQPMQHSAVSGKGLNSPDVVVSGS